MIKKYIKKPSIVEAVQFVDTSECLAEISKFIDMDFSVNYANNDLPILTIIFGNGDVVNAELGDFIVRDESGSIFAKGEDKFLKTHDVCD